ncbi:MAG: hypothetical protein ACTSRP_05290 [Candidatus Helarchaeota archaeon]
MDDISELLELINPRFIELQQEIKEYFEMKGKILDDSIRKKLDIPEEEILDEFGLDQNKLKDRLYLKEIILLAKHIIKNNEYFKGNWNTFGYYHREHNENLRKIISELEPIAEKIASLKVSYLNQILSDLVWPNILESEIFKENFIKLTFSKYDLDEYDSFTSLINKCVKYNDFYRLLPFLLRCLFENILYDIFRDSLDKIHTELFFDKNRNRARDFSQLINLLNLLKDKEYKIYIKDLINQNTINFLKDIQKIGNWTVHEIIKQIEKDFPDKWKGRINTFLESLLTAYKKLKGKNIKIENKDRLNIIKKQLGITERVKNQKAKKEKKNDNVTFNLREKKIEVQNLFNKLIKLFEKLYKTKAKYSPNFARQLYENREIQDYFGIIVKDPLPNMAMDDQEILFLDGLFKIIPNSATLFMKNEEDIYGKILDKNSPPDTIEDTLKKVFKLFINYVKKEFNIELELS